MPTRGVGKGYMCKVKYVEEIGNWHLAKDCFWYI